MLEKHAPSRRGTAGEESFREERACGQGCQERWGEKEQDGCHTEKHSSGAGSAGCAGEGSDSCAGSSEAMHQRDDEADDEGEDGDRGW